jgi:hypothetical protein
MSLRHNVEIVTRVTSLPREIQVYVNKAAVQTPFYSKVRPKHLCSQSNWTKFYVSQDITQVVVSSGVPDRIVHKILP